MDYVNYGVGPLKATQAFPFLFLADLIVVKYGLKTYNVLSVQ